MILMQGHAVTLTDFKGSDHNVARDMSFQYSDHFCETVVKSDFK